MAVRLPTSALVVLVGPSSSGKSTWAAEQFRRGQVVSSDELRALVGEGPHDQRAGTDAFELLDLVLERRLRRRLLTVVDSLALDAGRRAGYVALARRHRVACHAVLFETPADVCRRRNRGRERAVPAKVLAGQLAAFGDAREAVAGEGFDGVHVVGPGETVPAEIVPAALVRAPEWRERQREEPMGLRFGLQLPSFQWPGGREELAARLGAVATAAESAGVGSIWVMDHFLQIPQVGREWEDMPESWTTLAFLAGRTSRARLGTLVTGISYRNLAHLAKIVATLDVLSGGRAVCGLGAAWFEREHRAYGWRFPPLAERYRMLEDALRLLPLMWGPGSPRFEGRTITVDEAVCYPRPLQDRIPILVGGGGERTTLRLAARYADACNLFGDAATVRRKVAVLRRHCAAAGRPPADVEVTHLGTVLVATDRRTLAEKVERLRPPSVSPEAYAERVTAGTVGDLVGHFRELAEAGVQTAVVSLPDVSDPDSLAGLGEVIAAFDC